MRYNFRAFTTFSVEADNQEEANETADLFIAPSDFQIKKDPNTNVRLYAIKEDSKLILRMTTKDSILILTRHGDYYIIAIENANRETILTKHYDQERKAKEAFSKLLKIIR